MTKPAIKLFCFPYAGGSAMMYNKWKIYLNPTIELIPIELTGRGKRINEPLYKDVPHAIADVMQQVSNEIDNTPYAFFGHSMGAMIGYELTQQIKDTNLPYPQHIFFSGRGAPSFEVETKRKYHLMNEMEFKNAIIKLGGTPPGFFEHDELMRLFLPLLRNDFRLSETNICEGNTDPLNCNITVLLGMDEDLTPNQRDGWKNHTSKLCTTRYFEGGHFFIHHQMEKIIRVINSTLILNTHQPLNSETAFTTF